MKTVVLLAHEVWNLSCDDFSISSLDAMHMRGHVKGWACEGVKGLGMRGLWILFSQWQTEDFSLGGAGNEQVKKYSICYKSVFTCVEAKSFYYLFPHWPFLFH